MLGQASSPIERGISKNLKLFNNQNNISHLFMRFFSFLRFLRFQLIVSQAKAPLLIV
jgi:hypothetical protein